MKRLLILSILSTGLAFSPAYAAEVSKQEILKLTGGNPNARRPEGQACPEGFVEKWHRIEHSSQIGNPMGQPVQADFPPSIWQACDGGVSTLGRRKFNNGLGDTSHHVNQIFCDTFDTAPLIRPTQAPNCCQMIGARVAAVLKNSNNANWIIGDDASGDRFADFVGPGYSTISNGDVHSPWSSPSNPQQGWTWWWRWVSVSHVLDGKYSYIFTDDTDIEKSRLYGQYCCPKRLPRDAELNGGLSRQRRPNANELMKSITGDLPKPRGKQQMNAVPAQPRQLQQLQLRQLQPQRIQ